jgi:formylmethanofuran dehydrogenase subunit E
MGFRYFEEESMRAILIFALLSGLLHQPAASETREEWIALGARVHGGFSAFIPAGIRIGLDALERLKAKPREVSVLYFDSEQAPCACIADGIMIATAASPGQRTLQIASDKAPAGSMAIAIIRHKQTGNAVRYIVAESWIPKLLEWNRSLGPAGRYDAVMKASELFQVTPLKPYPGARKNPVAFPVHAF